MNKLTVIAAVAAEAEVCDDVAAAISRRFGQQVDSGAFQGMFVHKT